MTAQPTGPTQPADSDRHVDWGAFVRNVFAAAFIALVVGTLCYHFLADQSWGDAATSTLPWVILAILGAALGPVVVQWIRSARAK